MYTYIYILNGISGISPAKCINRNHQAIQRPDALSTARRRMIPAGLRWDPARCSPNPSCCRGKFPPIAPVRSGARVREILVKPARNIWCFFRFCSHDLSIKHGVSNDELNGLDKAKIFRKSCFFSVLLQFHLSDFLQMIPSFLGDRKIWSRRHVVEKGVR